MMNKDAYRNLGVGLIVLSAAILVAAILFGTGSTPPMVSNPAPTTPPGFTMVYTTVSARSVAAAASAFVFGIVCLVVAARRKGT